MQLASPSAEKMVEDLFDLITEASLHLHLSALNVTKTQFEDEISLELSDEGRFCRFDYSAQRVLPQGVTASVSLAHTGQDLRPLKGITIGPNQYLGLIDQLYLVEGEWHFLNPREVVGHNTALDRKTLLASILGVVFRD